MEDGASSGADDESIFVEECFLFYISAEVIEDGHEFRLYFALDGIQGGAVDF